VASTDVSRPLSAGARSRQTILRAAANLATVDGLEGISIGNLAAHIGMSKSGLYAHFRSKEELQLATVETAAQIFLAEVVQPVEGIADPLERASALCERFLSHVERRVFQGGCFFISVAAEFDTHPGAVHDAIAAAARQWDGRMEELLRRAQAAGSLRADEDPRTLAFELDAYLMMGNSRFVLHDDPAYLESARAAIAARLAVAAA
jgi:AcrR family transcriptional regulator